MVMKLTNKVFGILKEGDAGLRESEYAGNMRCGRNEN